MEVKSIENIQTKAWREMKMYNTYKSNIHVIQVLVDMKEWTKAIFKKDNDQEFCQTEENIMLQII